MGFLVILLGLPATTGGVDSGVPTSGSTSVAGSTIGSVPEAVGSETTSG